MAKHRRSGPDSLRKQRPSRTAAPRQGQRLLRLARPHRCWRSPRATRSPCAREGFWAELLKRVFNEDVLKCRMRGKGRGHLRDHPAQSDRGHPHMSRPRGPGPTHCPFAAGLLRLLGTVRAAPRGCCAWAPASGLDSGVLPRIRARLLSSDLLISATPAQTRTSPAEKGAYPSYPPRVRWGAAR